MKPEYTEGTDTKYLGKEGFKLQQVEGPEGGNELGVSEKKEKISVLLARLRKAQTIR